MLLDADGPERAAFDRAFDVCVIGSGPAGMSLALRLAARGLDVALMEAGGLEWSPESQEVYQGESVGTESPPLDSARLRFFGGTSFHWNGRARELDPLDFRAIPVNPLGDWPIDADALAPYKAATAEILDLVPAADALDEREVGGNGLRQVRFRRSAPTRFGDKYREEIAASPRIVAGLHANLVDLRLDEDRSRVTDAVFRGYSPGDPGFAVRAHAFALCAGGIENPRLLLNFTSQVPGGVGNGHDLVGRYFHDHPTVMIGEVLYRQAPEAEGTIHHAPTETFLRERETLTFVTNTGWRSRSPLPFFREAMRSAQCSTGFGQRLAEAVLGDRAMDCGFRGGLFEWYRRRDGLPFGEANVETGQALDPESRVNLAEGRDAFGLRRARLDWRVGETELRTAHAAALALGALFADEDLGRIRLYPWMASERPRLPTAEENWRSMSYHHMGTTRMSDDPRRGVVDRHCRVHGVANLYIGGSSVFPSGGFANPTYTIVQLALRLGDHLAGEIRS